MNKSAYPRLLALSTICLIGVTAFAAGKIPQVKYTLSGKVTAITDGDTVRVLVDQNEIKVRLEGIDAPESRQDYGTRSKQALSDLIFGKQIKLGVTGEDRYGRTLGKIYLGETDVNLQMIRDGWAWHYDYYNGEPKYAEAQQQARESGKGLWAGDDPVAPWDWRRK